MPEPRALLVSLEEAWRAGPSEALESLQQARLHANRAANRIVLGQRDLASNLLALEHYDRAQTLFDAERDTPLVRAERARVRATRATALSLSGDFARAEPLFAQAQQLFDEDPDLADGVAQRVAVRRNRAANGESMGEHAQARVLRGEADALIGPLPGPGARSIR